MAAKGQPKSGGRQKGSPNKVTGMLKDAILEAANLAGEDLAENETEANAGKVTYLRKMAIKHPAAFLSLVGRVIPMQLEGTTDDGAITINVTLEK